ncbi:hypothetical protein BDV35DRAFT_198652 [Aspergillus flavus]|uniref:Uncharacterized protein n=1 Tax=Aspergillus flavus TaxID=5059 RepID=A0A5N6GZI9_ASPFL|nr:hypothetical protein BDV35DRAFT_198652 [Aspergillus flavus]
MIWSPDSRARLLISVFAITYFSRLPCPVSIKVGRSPMSATGSYQSDSDLVWPWSYFLDFRGCWSFPLMGTHRRVATNQTASMAKPFLGFLEGQQIFKRCIFHQRWVELRSSSGAPHCASLINRFGACPLWIMGRLHAIVAFSRISRSLKEIYTVCAKLYHDIASYGVLRC